MDYEPLRIATTANGAPIVFARDERERHIYIAGKTGSGKSTLMSNLAMGDILSGEGVAFIDPHGDAESLERVPALLLAAQPHLDQISVALGASELLA